ncbi:MAG: hypothetical protein ABSC03_15140 [Verrucomicrobiota bacterium]
MNWQEPAALAVVAATAVVMVAARWSRRRQRPGRVTHCGCSGPPAGAGPTIIFHARKGERPVVIYKPR